MKPSKRKQATAARRAADPVAQELGRTDIDYSSDDLPTAPRRDVHGKVITEEHLKVAFTGFTPLAHFVAHEAAAPCSGGSAHCWHRSKIQHAMMNHRDEICCWCRSHQCVSLPVNQPEGHGQFLKETT